MIKQKKAFTFIELIISVVIITILSSIGFYSYVGHLVEARDTQRKANIGNIQGALKNYKIDRGAYPHPGDYYNITNSGNIVAFQGKLNQKVALNTMDKLPFDPHTETPYYYSTTSNRQEFQVAMTLENGEFPIALIEGDYKTVSKSILPNIVLAMESTSDIEIHTGIGDGSENRNYFILDGAESLPYTMEEPNEPYYSGENIDDLLSSGGYDFWQNSDFRSCSEISDAAKMIHTIGEEEYQIRSSTGALTNTGCIL